MELSEFRELLKAFPSLGEIVRDRLTTVAQVAVLRPTLGTGLGAGQEGGEDISSVR